MPPLNECRFCDIINGSYQYPGIDQPFISDNDYMAVASIGALIEGWSLIIPKSHMISMKNHYDKSEFAKFVGKTIERLYRIYGPLIAFEHGSNKEGSITSCGTDHAHLHIVPFKATLLPDLDNSGLLWFRCKTSKIFSKVGDKEYLFYTEINTYEPWDDPMGYLHILQQPISQFFRHLIAARIGQVGLSDYKQFPKIETALKTRRMLAEFVY